MWQRWPCVLLTVECYPLWISKGLGLLKHCNNSQHLTALCSTYCNRRTRFVPQSPWQARQGGSSSHVTHVLAGGPRNQRHGKHILSADLTRATSDENSRQMSTTTNKCLQKTARVAAEASKEALLKMTWVSTGTLGDDSKRKITKLCNDYMCSCTLLSSLWRYQESV